MANALCDRCKSLNLSVAKFRIKDKNGDEDDRSLELTRSRCYFGTVTQIRDSAENCKLCELIADTVRDANVPHMDDLACHLLWEMDGRTSAKPLVGHNGNMTRRLRVCWSDSRLKSCEAYVMLAAPPKYDKSDVDYPGLLNDETQFLGRRIGSSHNKKNLVREFLRLCETCHDERCTAKLGIEDPFRVILNEPYFGVIDMENESLVPLPYTDDGVELRFEAYATVSYVWGNGHGRQHVTRISNIQSRRKSGGLSAVIRGLPKALRQSIDLTHQLGIRYIWIDALCIVQNSRHSWNLNARAMHLIYGNSVLTICAADGIDANTGILALDDNHQTRQMVVNYGPGVCLMLHRPAETSIGTTQWNRRAWTFQERLLSKRCLIFTEGRIFFQCRSIGMSEDVFSDRLGRGWSLDLVRAPLQMLSQLKVRAMWFYAHCVALYTIRDLYEPFDILAAFNGMCKLIEGTIRAPFAFGLPTSHFDLALLWQPVGRSVLLEEANVSNDPKYKDMKFPTDVRTWILNHTWIDWHIRDGYGTLRRVWDTRHSEGDESEDVRWRGYDTVTRDQKENDNGGKAEGDESEDVRWRRSYYDTVTRDQKANDNGGKEETDTSSDSSSSLSFLEKKRASRRSRTEASRKTSLALKSNSKAIRKSQRQLSVRFSSQTDKFGRTYLGLSTLPNVSTTLSPEFTLTLPEDPYNVLTTETTQTSIPSSSTEEFPDQPFLQFFTWRAEFHVIRPETQSNFDVQQRPNGVEDAQTKPVQHLCRCEISDQRGDKCGSVVVDSEWLRNKENEHQTLFEFIAISDARDFTHEEFPDWTYYIAKERIESEWDLYFVLLVEFYPEEGIYRRVALGKVFKAAFTHLVNKEWKEIILG